MSVEEKLQIIKRASNKVYNILQGADMYKRPMGNRTIRLLLHLIQALTGSYTFETPLTSYDRKIYVLVRTKLTELREEQIQQQNSLKVKN